MLRRFWKGGLGLAAGLALLVAGCGGSDGNSDDNGAGGDNVAGTWRFVSASEDGVTVTAEVLGIAMTLTLNSDGSWTMSETEDGATEVSTGTWSTSGNQITVTTVGEPGSETMPFSLNGNTLQFTDADGALMTFTRI